MTGLSLGAAQAIARQIDWSSRQSSSTWAARKGRCRCSSRSRIRTCGAASSTCPRCVRISRPTPRPTGVADRLTFHPGDFFADPLPGADVIIMGHILHDWDLAQKRTLIAKAHAALPPGVRWWSMRRSSTTTGARTSSAC
jgi:hypothetical protein